MQHELHVANEDHFSYLGGITLPPSSDQHHRHSNLWSTAATTIEVSQESLKTAVENHILPLGGVSRFFGSSSITDNWKPEGNSQEILLQAFNWESWKSGKFYVELAHNAQAIADAGFTLAWLPPFTQSVDKQGYMPGDLYNLNSSYGTHEELKQCIAALQSVGLKVIGDAVLNHRCAQHQDEHGVWNKFGGKLDWDQRAIVSDQYEFKGRGNRSSGDCFGAAPNIDHSQDFVKKDLQEWLAWLRSKDVGFDGWRLDFVKGFFGGHVRDYMEASAPYFAVGEKWDTLNYDWDGAPAHNQDSHRQRTIDWINAAGGLSTAFDITTKGILHATFERCEYWRLSDSKGKPPGLLGWWPSRAVTFLENHDTGSTQGHWPFPHDAWEQGYCYILTHPGTPTVFWDHIKDRHLNGVTSRLIALRKDAGINCRSPVKIVKADAAVYAAEISATVESGPTLVMKIGPGDYSPGHDWVIADCGGHWAVWKKKV